MNVLLVIGALRASSVPWFRKLYKVVPMERQAGSCMLVPKDRISQWHEGEPFSAVETRYLTVRVPYSDAEFGRFQKSFSCFKTQFLPQEMRTLPEKLNNLWGGPHISTTLVRFPERR